MSVGRVGSQSPVYQDTQQMVYDNPTNEQFSQIPEEDNTQSSTTAAQGTLDSQNDSQDTPIEPAFAPGDTSDNSQEDSLSLH